MLITQMLLSLNKRVTDTRVAYVIVGVVGASSILGVLYLFTHLVEVEECSDLERRYARYEHCALGDEVCLMTQREQATYEQLKTEFYACRAEQE